jgi:uncharacterized membrane protein (UPF0127 family)
MPLSFRRSVRVMSPLLLTLAAFTATGCGETTAPSDIHFDTIQTTLKSKPFTLEVADTDAKRERGLMFRDSMPADHGMIFVFDNADKYGFWMKNTLIPLDILFLDESAKVVDIRTMQPHDENSTIPVAPALFTIELNAGTAKNIGIATGDQIPLPDKYLKHASHSDEK